MRNPGNVVSIPGRGQTVKEFNMTKPNPNARKTRVTTSLSEIKALCVVDENDCHVWQMSLNKGYAQWRLNKKTVKLLRVVSELAYGPPNGRHALHSCDNRACLNPDHLRWGTNLENIQDRVARGRSTTGEKSASAKLTWAKVAEIRSLYLGDYTYRSLAKEYDMSLSVIQRVVMNTIWVDVNYTPPIVGRGSKPTKQKAHKVG